MGTHWIDHAVVSVDDPALVERFLMETLDFRLAERAIESVEHPYPAINWTADQLAKGIFYHARELNEAFTTVFT